MAYGVYADTPEQIIQNGREISIRLTRTSPTTGEVTWTLPKFGAGCTVDDLAYNGIVIVLDTIPISLDQTPIDGTRYSPDPTANPDIHAGDKISTGLVVGGFYDDKETTTLTITNLVANQSYYIAGFAVDNVLRYHYEGVHTYSLQYGGSGSPDQAAYQCVTLGVQPSDLTGYQTGVTYQLPFYLNQLPPNYNWVDDLGRLPPPVPCAVPASIITFNGQDAIIWEGLVDELNYKFAIFGNPFQGMLPPNTGGYFYDTVNKKLYQWNGYSNILLDPIFSLTQPTMPAVGDYWVDTDTNQLFQWNGLTWVLLNKISVAGDPTNMPCGTLWFDGVTVYRWDGTVWIPLTTFIQSSDPSFNVIQCGAYWYDTDSGKLYKWVDITGSCPIGDDLEDGHWVEVTFLAAPTDPVLSPIGTYWYDTVNTKIKQFNGVLWGIITNAVFSPTAPVNPAINQPWFNTTTKVLSIWDGLVWVVTPVLISTYIPTTPPPGALWLDTTNNFLYEWSVITNSWVQVPYFYSQPDDPAEQILYEQNMAAWYNNVTNVLYIWDGSQWVACNYISYPTDPTIIVNGVYWYDITNDKWYVRSGGIWVEIFPTEYQTQPTSPAAGQYWIDTSNNDQLYQWNGLVWIPLAYTTSPLVPTVGTEWYDTTNNKLMIWNGTTWVAAIPPVTVSLSECGDLCFTTGWKGSTAFFKIYPPTPLPIVAPYYMFDLDNVPLTVTPQIQMEVPGTDGVSRTPMYKQIGIGTDGTADERREMIENILFALGHPSVQVQLTKPQLEWCVDQALQMIRRTSSSTYDRQFFFLDLNPGQQTYVLSDKTKGYHKIVQILGVKRKTSAFMSSAAGSGVFGQLTLQHLYQMGTFDLVSYHIISEYIELMEILFANRVNYIWNERARTLQLLQGINRRERVLIDCSVERTEQDIIRDRYLNNWIQSWSIAEAELILANTRGYFQTLPGAGGGIALNASDLRADAERRMTACRQEVDDYIANSTVEQFGMETQFVIG